MVLTTRKYTNQLGKMPWWQKIVLVLLGLYVFKQLLHLLNFRFNFNLNSTENFDGPATPATEGILNCTMYYAPWCGHCKTAKPEWEKLEQALNGKIIGATKIVVTKIDCDQNPQIAQEQKIDGFPTFKFEMHGKYYDYDGGRTFDEWKQFIVKLAK